VKFTLRNSLFWKLSLLLAAIVLFILSFVFHKIYTTRYSLASEVTDAERYMHRQQKDFNVFVHDTALIADLIDNKVSTSDFTEVVEKPYGIFLYSVNNRGMMAMRFWSTQLIMPPDNTFAAAEMEEFIVLPNGSYFIIKKTLNVSGETVIAYAMIPLRSVFFMDNEYLPQRFVYSNTADNRVSMGARVTEYPVKSLSGKTIFYFEKKELTGVHYNNRLTIILRFGGLLLLILFIHMVAESLTRSRLWKGIVFLGLSLIAIRVLIYWFPELLNLRQFQLFDPVIYGSNLLQRSLGDLFLNSAFLCWVVLFTWYKVQHIENLLERFPNWMRWTAGIFSLCLLIYSTFILSSTIRSIVANSKISFDVTDFYSLDRYTVVGFIVLACLTLSYYYLTQLLFRIIFPLFSKNTWPVYFAIGFSGLVYLTLRSGDPTVLFYIPVLTWLLIYTWLVNRQGLILNRIRINIAGILFWIFVFSVSIASIMLVENRKAEWERRKFYAQKQAEGTDRSNERVMSIAMKYIDEDYLRENFWRLKDSTQSRILRDSLIASNYDTYASKYETKLLVYDSSGHPLFNSDATTADGLNAILKSQAKATATPDLYYYETSFSKYAYITRRTATDTAGNIMGYFFVISNPRKYSSDALFPQLFKQYKKNDPENSPIYSFAVYSKKRLATYSNKYPFPTQLQDNKVPREEFVRTNNGDYDELWYRASNDIVVVMTRKRDTIIEGITLFSYIFCSFLFLVSFVQLLSLILKSGYNWAGVKKMMQLNIRAQVHGTVIFISIFSFVIIGIATISFFISRYERSNSDKLSRTMNIMVKEMEKKTQTDRAYDDRIKSYDSSADDDLQDLVRDVSDIHGVDVNVYDVNGDMHVSSEEDVYQKGVLSTKMDPKAFYYLSQMNEIQHVQKESISNLSYLSVYAPVRDENGKAYAYLSIPYFTSEQELHQEISNFIVTVINLNAFIFLIAGLIALFITNRITRSFSIISDKMKQVNLGKLNEEIVWNRDDEIGGLVTEYNKMVAKLGESAEALAKTEREGAWREMARQVAHEIKNPLTPMKLSIQYLQKAINNNYPNVKELSGNVANTLVEQIDHLSKIAADFSQFANIGNNNMEEFDLHDVLRSLLELFRADQNINFEWKPVHQRIMINADKTQMNRLFTNLIANAIEACNEQSCHITMEESFQNEFIRVSIRDNGEGIDPEMQSRIFIPNFTTKSSGTGLGLAMCKSIVEQAKGQIWFETEKGTGTVFHVEIPLLN
jgi:signal transduction histidine kinase